MPGSFTFRQPGEYLRADRPIDAPLGKKEFRSGFDIMKFQSVIFTEAAVRRVEGALQS